MGFLDNLENNLKALESREERDPEKVRREQERREADRTSALLREPICHTEILREPHDEEYGHRRYDVVDPEGHRWYFAQVVREVAAEDWGATPAEAAR